MDCLGDQQEAIYYITSPLPTDSNQVYAVVGTLATETGNATYVGLSANDVSIMGGVTDGTVIDTDLKGSADVYWSTRITSYNVCYTKLLREGAGRRRRILFHCR